MIVTLVPDLAKQVNVLARRRGLSFEQALNEAPRRGLTPPGPRDQPIAHPGGASRIWVSSGIDRLDVEDVIMECCHGHDDPSVAEQR